MERKQVDKTPATNKSQGSQALPQESRPFSRKSTYSLRRSSSIWSMASVLTAITTPRSSSRQSRIGSVKPDNTSTHSLSSGNLDIPKEVLVCIIQHLRSIHEGPGSVTCSSCFNKDAYNLALVNRAWNQAVRHELHRCIHVDGPDGTSRRYHLKTGLRLKLLRRTLRDQSCLAKAVQELRIWNAQTLPDEAMQDQIASVIMACPNLQTFTGSQVFYNNKFSKIHHALGTRRYLKSHLWIVSSQDGAPQYSASQKVHQFLGLHSAWHKMTALALHCQRGAIFQRKIFLDLTQLLPALENLSISGFPASSFDDETLLALKPLKSLRLADISGLSDRGLSRFSHSPQAKMLTSLSLINLKISSLYTISSLLSNIPLINFTLVHFRALSHPATDLIIQPLLASNTLKSLHWEVPLVNHNLSLATSHLASSIQYSGLPALGRLRCPTDTDTGTIQSLCKPHPQSSNSGFESSSQLSGTTLRASRLRSFARKTPGARSSHGFESVIQIRVTNPNGIIESIVETNWLGYVGSDQNIEYSLISDVGNWEQRRFLVEEGDCMGEILDGNTGRCRGMGAQRHIERERWRGIGVEGLF